MICKASLDESTEAEIRDNVIILRNGDSMIILSLRAVANLWVFVANNLQQGDKDASTS